MEIHAVRETVGVQEQAVPWRKGELRLRERQPRGKAYRIAVHPDLLDAPVLSDDQGEGMASPDKTHPCGFQIDDPVTDREECAVTEALEELIQADDDFTRGERVR